MIGVFCAFVDHDRHVVGLARAGSAAAFGYIFFEQCAKVFEQDGRAVPVYNDKHLSYSFEKAKAMVDTSRRLRFPMLAGSSIPVTWRLPSWCRNRM